jgi:hypothetical protein
MHTLKERLSAGLQALGWRQIPGRSKYETWTKSTQKHLLFVGTHGALRAGPCASKSWSIGDSMNRRAFYMEVITEGDKVLEQQGKPPVLSGI